ncbi:chromosomal replication initiator protein DnaA [Carnobacteriaceae bacterium zg-ZUI252]|nr:chromosomal replication initiator protein DnaA [Carnobacteriaceae bacterium zg-ZUI252]MBS4770652.1 chromosomal replication initiator protein DnaA [Carnobacteriaceae bacterium zg-ZUI240]QTU82954.1 chromosomal replication initiator protein DnaA [Carnobacteriaceae bacterium zg-C25]
MENAQAIWENLLVKLQHIFAPNIYNSFILPAKPISFYQNTFIISVNQLIRPHWDQFLQNSITQILSENYPNITIVVQSEIEPIQTTPPVSLPQNHSIKLKPQYTFDNFIVGEGNRMAHAAALAVSDSPGNFYNPLFIYGGSGLGKTHLMHAIGNSILQNKPQANIRYVTSEDFVNEFTTAIRHGAMEEFKNNYRQVDLLLVDDIQFLAGKEQTLDEFFHTFNTLRDAGKQIVLTSDRLATEIPELPARLVSRFSSGLSSDITPPDLETRTAILRKKANSNQITIPDETLNYIAGQVNSNVRELEAALTRVNFYAVTKRQDITTSLAAEALQSLFSSDESKMVSIFDIQNEVCKLFNVTIEQLKGKQRNKEIVIPRQIAMYLSREITDNSLPKIGQAFNKKDHTTVMHACMKIDTIIQENSDILLIQQINQLKSKLR